MSAPQIQVVGYDGSSLAERALRRAVIDASRLDFAVLHVVSVVEEDGDHVILPSGERLSRWSAVQSLRLTVDHLLESWQVPTRLLRVSGHIRAGDPARALVDLAYRQHAERLLVGAHSDGTLGLGRVGSVAQRVMDLADFAVHIESPLGGVAQTPEFDPLRFAFVFGGGGGPRVSSERNVPQA